jgi:hypothetical protein
MTGMYHHVQLLLVEMGLANFCLSCPGTTILLISASHVAGMTCAQNSALLLIEMASQTFLPRLALNHDPPDLHLLSS